MDFANDVVLFAEMSVLVLLLEVMDTEAHNLDIVSCVLQFVVTMPVSLIYSVT